jgi:integrase
VFDDPERLRSVDAVGSPARPTQLVVRRLVGLERGAAGEATASHGSTVPNCQVSIRQTLAYVGARAELGEPKTPSARRLVVVPPDTVTALREHRRRQLEERLAAGHDYEDSGLVFCDPRGAQLSPSTVSRRFERLAREAGLPRLSLHGLRHTFATLALKAGIPSKVVAEVLGHASARTTEDIYTHVTPGMQGDATARVAALLTRS